MARLLVVDQRQLLDDRNEVKELVPEGTRDVAGNLVTVDEVNMDYGGYRLKVKKGGRSATST